MFFPVFMALIREMAHVSSVQNHSSFPEIGVESHVGVLRAVTVSCNPKPQANITLP